ncbi:MAG: hypothetical protein JWR19_1081 [Pedosphaera sp.]|nr:hypothetical protein [Pedosphaera sp.]
MLPGNRLRLILHRRLDSVPKNDSGLERLFGCSPCFPFSTGVFAAERGHQLKSERAMCFGVELCVTLKVIVKIGSHDLTDFHSFEQGSEHGWNKVFPAEGKGRCRAMVFLFVNELKR